MDVINHEIIRYKGLGRNLHENWNSHFHAAVLFIVFHQERAIDICDKAYLRHLISSKKFTSLKSENKPDFWNGIMMLY